MDWGEGGRRETATGHSQLQMVTRVVCGVSRQGARERSLEGKKALLCCAVLPTIPPPSHRPTPPMAIHPAQLVTCQPLRPRIRLIRASVEEHRLQATTHSPFCRFRRGR